MKKGISECKNEKKIAKRATKESLENLLGSRNETGTEKYGSTVCEHRNSSTIIE